MSEMKRYVIAQDEQTQNWEMFEDESGEYVLHSDYDRLSAELAEAKKECERLKERNLDIVRGSFTQICSYCGWEAPPPNGWEELQKHIKECPSHPLRQLEAELATLKETKEACGVLASITKTFGGMRDNASYEAEIAEAKREEKRWRDEGSKLIRDLQRVQNSEELFSKQLAELKAEKEKADQIIKDLSGDRMLYKDMAERAGARMKEEK